MKNNNNSITICLIATAPGKGPGGGMSIYLQLCDAIRRAFNVNYEWHIFVSEGMPTPTIENASYHIVNTKGISRFLFDWYGFQKVLSEKKINPDAVISLQNTIPNSRCNNKYVYYHQPLPFYSYPVKISDPFFKTYLFYHYLYPLYVKSFLNRKTFVVVQTNIIKDCFIKKFRHDPRKIGVYFPEIERPNQATIEEFNYDGNYFNFVYPANASSYKEHITLFYALQELYKCDSNLAKKIRFHFTVNSGALPYLKEAIEKNEMKDNFIFYGHVSHDKLLAMIKSSHGLVFPSVIETLGLPLLETASLGVPVVANDIPYAKEVLGSYEGAIYALTHNYKEWANKIITCCKGKPLYFHPYFNMAGEKSWDKLLRMIAETVNR